MEHRRFARCLLKSSLSIYGRRCPRKTVASPPPPARSPLHGSYASPLVLVDVPARLHIDAPPNNQKRDRMHDLTSDFATRSITERWGGR